MRNTLLILLVIYFFNASCQPASYDRVLVSVTRNYKIPTTEKAIVSVPWSELVNRCTSLKPSNIRVVDQHFGKSVQTTVIDSNSDGKPEFLNIDYTFSSSEPVFAFMVTADGINGKVVNAGFVADTRFKIDYLSPYSQISQVTVANAIVQSSIHKYPDPKDLSIISPGKWTYEYGFFLNAAYKLYQQNKNDDYYRYAKKWVDGFIDENGKFKDGVYDMSEYRLDDILPGRLCIYLYQQTREKKYKAVADLFIEHLKKQPRTSEGGYWHKDIYRDMMWLDGIYMGDVFSMQYAAAFDQPEWFDEAAHQIKLIEKHTYDPSTGLFFHGWDESKRAIWANQKTGASPELWSRAIGWYAMALVECLDYLPKDHSQRRFIESTFQRLCMNILKYQDKKSSLWFQVIDKGTLKDNWIETSGSAMFAYAFAKGSSIGLLSNEYKSAATLAYNSILNSYVYVDSDSFIHLDQAVKVGSLNTKNSDGSYAYYVNCERRLDDYKGLAALLYLSIELKK